MQTPDLWLICMAAFFWVFTILIILALVMRLIILLFPQKQTGHDSAVIAALAVSLQQVFPGTKITKIEEKK